ncbi:MAG TPA: HD domain-containing phosphohydrolase [Thermoanaerobaculia bacterium]|nr:HD domain-containing phosphohydrolase [Thermoanaerobaculia bacterium]
MIPGEATPSREARSGATNGQNGGAPAASPRRHRWLRLGNLLFLCLLLSGIIPLVLSSLLSVRKGRELLMESEKEHLLSWSDALSRQLDSAVAARRDQLRQLGESVVARGGELPADQVVAQLWVHEQIAAFQRAYPQLETLWVLEPGGNGPRARRGPLSPAVDQAVGIAFEQARSHSEPVYRVASQPRATLPILVAAVPVGEAERQLVLISSGMVDIGELVASDGRSDDVSVLLLGASNQVLWADASGHRLLPSLEARGVLDGLAQPVQMTRSVEVEVDGSRRKFQLTSGPISTPGWQVVVLKDSNSVFAAVNRMIYGAGLASLFLLLLALLFAAFVARNLGKPLSRLAENTRQIAAGNFSHRIETRDLTFEMAELAENFNVMGGHVERYVEELKRAASANRDLFLGSIRAFAAAIDAKDPYTRGHSERVAAVSRAVARHLGFDEEFQQRVWLAALLHDVGKIGVDDRVLKKGGLLSPEEYEQMKMHTVVGAEIMGRIEQLKEIVPAVRWHHESWNGRGYPDGLKGEQIPLIARIVAVADTFDAVTTNRPYQQAYTPEFAVNTITKLAGTRFDAKVVTAFLSAFNAGQIDSAVQRHATAPALASRVAS